MRPYYLKGLYFKLNAQNCPRHFRDCWRFPTARVDSFVSELGRERLVDRDLVFFPMADWHACMQRSQHLATTLAAMGHRCFYVNPHLGREFPNTWFRSPRVLLTRLGTRVFELHVHLWREPVFHHRRLRDDECARLVETVSELFIAARSSCPVLIVSFPLWEEVASELRRRFGCLIVYDCHDLLTGFGNISKDLLAAEARLLSRSDLVVCSAEPLLDHIVGQHPSVCRKTALVRNGVHQRHFQSAAGRNGRKGTDTPRTVGYIGALNFWFDSECVRRAALAHPEWRFLLVGPVATRKLDHLRAIPNVSFKGEVAYRDLASYLAEMDVAIIPFVSSPLTLATNPIKLYEYFACGLPVVSARLPEVELYGDLTYLADTPDQFVVRLETAMQEDDPVKRLRRIQIAQEESWSARCTQLIEAISTVDPDSRAHDARSANMIRGL